MLCWLLCVLSALLFVCCLFVMSCHHLGQIAVLIESLTGLDSELSHDLCHSWYWKEQQTQHHMQRLHSRMLDRGVFYLNKNSESEGIWSSSPHHTVKGSSLTAQKGLKIPWDWQGGQQRFTCPFSIPWKTLRKVVYFQLIESAFLTLFKFS